MKIKSDSPTMASIHRGLLGVSSVVQFWDFAELDSKQPAKPQQLFNPYVC